MPATDKELLFNDLLQPHWENFARDVKTLVQQRNVRPKVFISYAWPNSRYPGYDAERDIQPWLLGLYERLTGLGATVLFDIKTMTLGTNIDQFMQQSVEHGDKILMISTDTYYARSKERQPDGSLTNVGVEINHICQKITAKGDNCVIPIVYSGDFANVKSLLGAQILGTSCSNEFLYQENLPVLIEELFGLLNNADYQALKQKYLDTLKNIKDNGLSESTLEAFSTQRMKKEFGKLIKQREAVNVLMENFKTHPDYASRSLEPPSVKMNYLLSHLKEEYQRHTHVTALFGEPMALEGQYINVQMLYQVTEEKKLKDPQAAQEDEQKAEQDKKKEFYDARITSYEEIFSKKEPLAIEKLFTPAKALLTANQKAASEARPDLPPNFILLQGRAGIGKTTFVTFVTREWALGRLWPEYHWVFSLRFRDLPSISADDEKEKVWTLEKWIYKTYFKSKIDKKAFQSLWDWLIEPDLKNKKILFILDGYDEAPTYHPCKKALHDLLSSDTPKIVTSRPYGLSDLPQDRRELEVVGFIDDNVEKYVNLYFKDEQNKAKAIITGLKPSRILWGSAHIPVTLNVLCGLLENDADVPNTIAKLNTMSGLYEAMEMSLLERAYRKVPNKEEEHANQLKPPVAQKDKNDILAEYYKDLRLYLGKMAFDSFSRQKLILEPEEVFRLLTDAGVPKNKLNEVIKQLSDLGIFKSVIDDITHKESKYEFLHLTFQEYYAARHLLWSVENNSSTLIEDFASIKLDPRYQIVLWFLAGTIKDKDKFNSFMRALTAPQGGDMLGNVQLGLMIRCTEENWELAQEMGWTVAITKMLQRRIPQESRKPVWAQMLKISIGRYTMQTGNLDLYAELSTQQIEIGYGFSFVSPRIQNILATTLIHGDRYAREGAAKNIAELGIAVLSDEIFVALTKLLVDDNGFIRNQAIATINELAATTETSEFLVKFSKLIAHNNWDVSQTIIQFMHNIQKIAPASKFFSELAKLLTNSDPVMFNAAIKVIGDFSELAGTEEIIIDKLIKLLISDQIDRRAEAAYLMGKLGTIAATPEILTSLSNLLRDGDENIRAKSVYAIGKLRTTSIMPEILTSLSKLLADSNDTVRANAIHAVCDLGAIASTPEILIGLGKLLVDNNSWIRQSACDAIGPLNIANAPAEFFALLANFLSDSNQDIRQYAAESISKLDPAIATLKIVMALTTLLGDSNEETRQSASYAIGKFCKTISSLQILKQLVTSLADNRAEVRKVTAETIGKIGTQAATTEILTGLTQLLSDTNEDTCKSAINAIGALGSVAAIPKILSQLARLSTNNNKDIGIATAWAISKLGPPAVTEGILTALVQMMADSDENVCISAAQTISTLGTAAITSKVIDMLADLLTHKKACVRRAIADVIDNLGTVMASPAILSNLAKLATDEEWIVRRSAADAIGNLGAVTPEILHGLKKLCKVHDSRLVEVAFSALYQLSSVATTPEIFIQLVTIMAETEQYPGFSIKVINNFRCLDKGVNSLKFLTGIVQLLANSDDYICSLAATIINKLSVTSTPGFFFNFAKLLENSAWEIRLAAAKVLSKLDTSASTPAILMGFPTKPILSAGAATPEILTQLIKLLTSNNNDIRFTALKAIGSFHALAATNKILAELVKLLANNNIEMRKLATYTLGELGAAAAVPQCLILLSNLLLDQNMDVRFAAAEAVSKIGTNAATPDILIAFSKLLTETHSATINAISKLGAAAATTEVLSALAKLMVGGWSSEIAFAIGEIGAAAATPEITTQLSKLLTDNNMNIYSRVTIAKVIGKLGHAAATSEILTGLANLLTETDHYVYNAAANTISKLGVVAATPLIITELSKLLARDSQCEAAWEAVSNLGPAAAIPEILAQFPKLLTCVMMGSGGRDIEGKRETANEVIKKLGAAAATPELLIELVQLKTHRRKYVREAASEIINELHDSATNAMVIISLLKSNNNHTLFELELVHLYLCKREKNFFPTNNEFPLLAAAIIVGGYMSGNISIHIAFESKDSTYYLRGFADKKLFNISITHEQAQWFIYWTPKVIHAFNEKTLGEILSKIEQSGISINSNNSPAWFDHLSHSPNSSRFYYHAKNTEEYRTAYGLCSDVFVPEVKEQEEVPTEDSDNVITKGVKYSGLTLIINHMHLNKDDKDEILKLIEDYSENCSPANITRNSFGGITKLTFDHIEHLNDLKYDLSELISTPPRAKKK